MPPRPLGAWHHWSSICGKNLRFKYSECHRALWILGHYSCIVAMRGSVYRREPRVVQGQLLASAFQFCDRRIRVYPSSGSMLLRGKLMTVSALAVRDLGPDLAPRNLETISNGPLNEGAGRIVISQMIRQYCGAQAAISSWARPPLNRCSRRRHAADKPVARRRLISTATD